MDPSGVELLTPLHFLTHPPQVRTSFWSYLAPVVAFLYVISPLDLVPGERARAQQHVLNTCVRMPQWRGRLDQAAATRVFSLRTSTHCSGADVLPLIGWLDDLLVLVAVAWFLMSQLSQRQHGASAQQAHRPAGPAARRPPTSAR